MKVLILIMSCLAFEKKGVHQALRDTWLQEVKNFPGLEYKIVVGDGTPVQETVAFRKSWDARSCRYENNSTFVEHDPYTPREDELLVQAPDDFQHLCFKTKLAYEWAIQQGFDFIFHCYGDVYVDVPRLMSCGFENCTFWGNENGGGFWVCRKLAQIIPTAEIVSWNDDGWVRDVLGEHGTSLIIDPRYGAYPDQPLSTNDFITSHTNISPEVFNAEKMHIVHRRRLL